MVSACVLIACGPGRYPGVAERIRGLKGVVRAFSASGRWDVVAEIEAANLKGLTEIALRINGLPGVRATETLVEAPL